MASYYYKNVWRSLLGASSKPDVELWIIVFFPLRFNRSYRLFSYTTRESNISLSVYYAELWWVWTRLFLISLLLSLYISTYLL